VSAVDNYEIHPKEIVMHRLKFVLAGLLFASPAFAQGGEEGVLEGEAGAEVTTGDTTVAADVGGAVALGWSRSLVDRPYIVGKGKIGAYGGYSILRFSFTEPITGTTISGTGDALGVGAGYGVTDTINVGAQYAFTPGIIGDGDFEIKGNLGLFGNFQLIHNDKMSVTANADFSMNLCGGRDAMGDCVSSKAINAGLGARYKLAPNMAVFTGSPVGPGPVGQHLSISLESGGPITFDVPVGFMFQATPELNIQASTNLATIGISNSNSAFFGADFIPLGIGALFSVSPNLDVVGQFTLPDLKDAGFDLLLFSIGARYYN
jgi:hypothetical protein